MLFHTFLRHLIGSFCFLLSFAPLSGFVLFSFLVCTIFIIDNMLCRSVLCYDKVSPFRYVLLRLFYFVIIYFIELSYVCAIILFCLICGCVLFATPFFVLSWAGLFFVVSLTPSRLRFEFRRVAGHIHIRF